MTPNLAETIDNGMGTDRELVVYDPKSRSWHRSPWHRVRSLGRLAAGTLAEVTDERGPVGIIGAPVAELAATVYGAWATGRGIAILPGMVHGADPDSWAASVISRLRAMGCGVVLAHGRPLQTLRNSADAGITVMNMLDMHEWTAPALRPDTDTDTETAAILQGTAGSTGEPKTAIQSFRAVLNHFRAAERRIGLDPKSDVICSWLPLYHDMGLLMLTTCMASGTPLWLAAPSAFAAAPLDWITWLSTSRATITPAPNFAFDIIGRFARKIDGVDLSAIRYAVNGGEPIDCDAMARFGSELRAFGFDANSFAPAYGLAEATCAVTAPEPGRGLRCDGNQAILGKPFDGVEVRIVPGNSAPAIAGRSVGDIEVRGNTLMSGYVNSGRRISPDDWCDTGDIGYLVGDELIVCGRSKEIITFAGRNLFPQQIEAVTARVPGVRNGAVVATSVRTGPAGRRRDGLVIAAEFRGDESRAASDRISHLVAAECGVVPMRIDLLEPGKLPRTTSGKLRRLEVSTWYRQET